jgi:putative flippase GtrA
MVANKYKSLSSAVVERLRRYPMLAWFVNGGLGSRFTKYALGSVVAFTAGNIAFALLYVMDCSTTVCSVVGFVAAAIPNWILNRRWAWQQSGKPPARQWIGYALVSIAVLVSSSAATGWTNSQVQSLPKGDGLRVLIVTGAYVLVQVVQFIVKFAIYEYWIFADGSKLRAGVKRAWRSMRAKPATVRTTQQVQDTAPAEII